jgi:pimeloyl-ACP methyl ester carboxylesterase
VVLVHGVPDHSEQWVPFLERLPGPALAFDLPGFGRSDRPDPGAFPYTARAQGAFVGRALERLGVGEHRLVVHDWGSVALIAAQRRPERVKRLCVINAVPLLPGYRWHRTARIWRTPVLGELATRVWSPRLLSLGLRESRGDWSRPPDEFVHMISEHLDRGASHAILRLYRSAPRRSCRAARRGAPAAARARTLALARAAGCGRADRAFHLCRSSLSC